MNSLQELNAASALQLDVSDQRGSRAVFDRVLPLTPIDQVINITTTTVVVNPGIEIVEIINYATANVRYRVTINTGGSPLLTGSAVSWTLLPTNLIVTQVGNQYTVSGIETIADWDGAKQFVWTLPANFATCPNWFLDVAIVYYDSDLGQDVVKNFEVYDEDFYYIADLFIVSSLSTIVGVRKQFASSVSTVSTFDFPGSRVVRFSAAMSTSSSVLTSGIDLDLAQAQLNTVSSMVIIAGARRKATAAMAATSSLVTVINHIQIVANLTAKNYLSNNSNAIFVSPFTPNIPDTDTSATFLIELSSNIGNFGFVNGAVVGTFSYPGPVSSVNSFFPSIYFWPNKGATGSGTFTYRQYKNGTLQTTRVLSLTNVGDFGVPTQLYTFDNAGTFTFQPTQRQRLYAVMDYLVVGGGGSGSGFGSISPQSFGVGGGGGGGAVNYLTGQNITQTSYSVIVGQGGMQNAAGNGVGGPGGLSRFGPTDSAGGAPGEIADWVGGNAGATFTGGAFTQNISAGSTLSSIGAGGGAGAAANGLSGTTSIITVNRVGVSRTGFVGQGGNGGVGVSNSISGSSVVYASGGGGGARHTDVGPFSGPKPVEMRRGINGARTAASRGQGGIGGEFYQIHTGANNATPVQNNADAGVRGTVIVNVRP